MPSLLCCVLDGAPDYVLVCATPGAALYWTRGLAKRAEASQHKCQVSSAHCSMHDYKAEVSPQGRAMLSSPHRREQGYNTTVNYINKILIMLVSPIILQYCSNRPGDANDNDHYKCTAQLTSNTVLKPRAQYSTVLAGLPNQFTMSTRMPGATLAVSCSGVCQIQYCTRCAPTG